MQENLFESSKIEVDAVVADTCKVQEPSFFSANISKQQLIALLKKNGVHETNVLENPDVRAEGVIPTLRKAKVKVPEAFFQDLASKLELPFLKQTKLKKLYIHEQWGKFLTVLPYRVVENYLIVPLEITKTSAKIVLANPLDRKTLMLLQLLLGTRQISWVLASYESIDMAIENVYREIHTKNALLDLYNRNPDESAHKVLFRNQKYFIIASIIAITVGAAVSFGFTFAFLFATVNVAYFLFNPLKIYISLRGFQKSRDETFPVGSLLKTEDEKLP